MALDLTTAAGRIRYAVGDQDEPPLLPALTGAADPYAAVLAQAGGDEPTAFRTAARGLATYLMHEAISISASGKSLSYDTARVGRLLAMAAGSIPYPFDADGNAVVPVLGGDATIEVVW